MKKIFVLLALVAPFSVFSQIKAGVMAGISSCNLEGHYTSPKSNTSFSANIWGEQMLLNWLGLRFGLDYDRRSGEAFETEISAQFIALTVGPRFHFQDIGSNAVFLFSPGLYSNIAQWDGDIASFNDIGVSFQTGVEWRRFSLLISCKRGLTDIVKQIPESQWFTAFGLGIEVPIYQTFEKQ